MPDRPWTWERERWLDEVDDSFYDLPLEEAELVVRFEGEAELEARLDHDWYEDVEHNGLLPERPWREPGGAWRDSGPW